MQQTLSLNPPSLSASKLFASDDHYQNHHQNSLTIMTSEDGTVLCYDANGRITKILGANGEEQKSFLYNHDGDLLSFTNQGYRLSKTSDKWTDGIQLFDLEVFVNDIGVVTVADHSCSVVTLLQPDGSFVVTVLAPLQYAIHHSASPHNRVEQIDYPDGTKRTFQFNCRGQLVIVDEPDGYWFKVNSGWVHYNSENQIDGLEALELDVNFNGATKFVYANGRVLTITADGVIHGNMLSTLAA